MFYIIGNGLIIEQYDSCPDQDDLECLGEECGLDELWVIDGQHAGITWARTPDPAPKKRIVFGQRETYPDQDNERTRTAHRRTRGYAL